MQKWKLLFSSEVDTYLPQEAIKMNEYFLPFQEPLVEAEAAGLFDLMASFDDSATYQG